MSLLLSAVRDLRAAPGGHGTVREEVWPALGSPAGGTVCGLYSGARPHRGGALSDAGTSQPRQRSAGFFWLWRETPVWQVSWHHQIQAGVCVTCKICQEYPCSDNPCLCALSIPSFSLFESADGASSCMVMVVEAFIQLRGGPKLIDLCGAPSMFQLKHMLNEKHCQIWVQQTEQLVGSHHRNGYDRGELGDVPAFRCCILPAHLPGAISWLFLCHQVSE